MPLARGSAFCGYVSMLAAFLAAGAPVRASMPPVRRRAVQPAARTSVVRCGGLGVWWMRLMVPGGGGVGVGPAAAAASPAAEPAELVVASAPSLPQSYQTDWEAILEGSPERFIASVSSWMYPPEVQQAQQAQPAQQQTGHEEQHAQQQQERQQPQQNGQGPASSDEQAGGGSLDAAGGGGGASSPAAAAQPPCKPVDQLPKVKAVERAGCVGVCAAARLGDPGGLAA